VTAQRGKQPGNQPGRRSGRRAGDSGTRQAILEAARRKFADLGYDGATIRAIAADAGVDPALVHHFYGSKERLFAAAMQLPFIPSEVITAALTEARPADSTIGEHAVRTALALWESPAVRVPFVGLLRSALTSEQASTMLGEFIGEAILRPLASQATTSDPATAAYRAAAVGSQIIGLALTRYVLQLGPIAAADPEELVATIGPTIDRYLTGS
jgi:AcrR family transcriptional regulator